VEVKTTVLCLFAIAVVCGGWAIKLYIDDVVDEWTKPLKDYFKGE
jgi:hypothetical protein